MALLLEPIIAHRGDRAYAPENTLVAIRQAAAKGAQWVEFDATLARDTDKPVVIFHDDRVGRTTNLPDEPLTEVSFDELRSADAGSWFAPAFAGEQVPTLIETVKLCQELGLGMNIEIKVSSNGTDSPEPFDEVLATLTAKRVIEDLADFYWDDGKVLLSSFSTVALMLAKEMAPYIPRGYLLHKLWPQDVGHDQMPEYCRRLALVQPQTANFNHELLGSLQQVTAFTAIIEKTLGHPLPLLAYTVNDVARAKELLEWGVFGVFTDSPGELLGLAKPSGAEPF